MIADNKMVQNDPPKEKIKSILELFNSNKLIETKKEIDKQSVAYPKSAVLFNILGAVFFSQNKLQEALANYNKSIIKTVCSEEYVNQSIDIMVELRGIEPLTSTLPA